MPSELIRHSNLDCGETNDLNREVSCDRSTLRTTEDPIAGLLSDFNVPSFGTAHFPDLDLGITDFDAAGLI